MKELIEQFLKEYGTEVREGDDAELIMDDHICVDWKSVYYYIKENNSMYSDDDEHIVEFLSQCRRV